jgi:hypothetical protein
MVGVGRLELPTFRLSGECSKPTELHAPVGPEGSQYMNSKWEGQVIGRNHSPVVTRGLSGFASIRGPLGTIRWKI